MLASFAVVTAIPFFLSSSFFARDGDHENTAGERAPFDADTRAIDTRRYPDVSYAATHNSYSGGIALWRTSIRAQLDRGVRSLELDIHDDDYAEHTFRVGHLAPGDAVYHEDGNPEGDELAAWLKIIADWSDAHPQHAPITLLLDLKDGLGGNRSFEDGDLFALNDTLEKIFGDKLLPSENIQHDAWPAISELRGRILTVLSGDEESRLSYRGQHGKNPAVAINGSGQVLVVQDDGEGALWAWTGRALEDGTVSWLRRERYDTGSNPAIAIGEHGFFVEVHQDPNLFSEQLWYRTGRIDIDGAIVWSSRNSGQLGDKDDEAIDPTVDFTGEKRVIVTHRLEDGSIRGRVGDLDLGTGELVWEDKELAGVEASDETQASAGGRNIQVYTSADGGFDGDTLLYRTSRSGQKRVRPAQLAFVEVQHGNEGALERDGLYFYSGPAAELSARIWASGKRAAGKVARLWCFNDAELTAEASVNFPATDLPFSQWYRGYENTLGCVK